TSPGVWAHSLRDSADAMDARTSALKAVSDVSPADWLRGRIDDFGPVIGGILPRGVDAYAKVLHPAESHDGEKVRWSAVSAWSGQALDQGAWFQDLSVPSASVDRGPQPWPHDPQLGEIPEELLAVLVEVLSRHTISTDGWFCIWDG